MVIPKFGDALGVAIIATSLLVVGLGPIKSSAWGVRS